MSNGTPGDNRQTPRWRSIRGFLLGGFVMVAVGAGATETEAAEIECESLDIHVEMRSSGEAKCWRSFGGDGDFKIEWQTVQVISGDRIVLAELQRVVRLGSFYRPSLEEAVELVFWSDVVDSDWGASIEHENYRARKVELTFEDGDTMRCFGFLDHGSGPYGGVKSMVYGLVCNLNGIEFSEAEAAEILNRVVQ